MSNTIYKHPTIIMIPDDGTLSIHGYGSSKITISNKVELKKKKFSLKPTYTVEMKLEEISFQCECEFFMWRMLEVFKREKFSGHFCCRKCGKKFCLPVKYIAPQGINFVREVEY